jgi:hypothetical protein
MSQLAQLDDMSDARPSRGPQRVRPCSIGGRVNSGNARRVVPMTLPSSDHPAIRALLED